MRFVSVARLFFESIVRINVWKVKHSTTKKNLSKVHDGDEFLGTVSARSSCRRWIASEQCLRTRNTCKSIKNRST